MVDSAFFENQAAEFTKATNHRKPSELPLTAKYDPRGWGLEHLDAFRSTAAGNWLLENGTANAVQHFKNLAGKCAVALGSTNRDSVWTDWLDHLRRQAVGFETSSLRIRRVDDLNDANAETIEEPIGEIADVWASSAALASTIASEQRKVELAAAHVESSVPNDLIPVREAAEVCAVNSDTFRKWIDNGVIPHYRVGPSTIRVSRRDVIALVRPGATESTESTDSRK